MKLLDTPKPEKGTLAYKLAAFFVNHINFCEGYYYGTELDKPENPLYNFFYKYWLFPFRQNDCICCNTVRGVLYGVLIGYILGVLL